MRQANAALTALLNGQKKALQFTTASANYVSVPNASSLNPSGSFALGFWFRVLADVLGYALHLASKAGPADGTATFVVYHFGSTSGTDRQLIVYGGSGGVWNKISGTFNLTIGTLYHLFFTFNPATGGQLYINGQPIGVRTAPGAIGNNTNILQVGAWGTAPDQAMIDEFRYYVGRDFSATEVTEHYQGIFRNESGLVGYWPFDEGTGTTAFDLSGKGNNGTLVNAPVYVDFNPYPGTERQFRIADLLTITLVNGITLRYTSADIDITSGGNLFSSKGPQFTRGKTKMVVGIVVDEMDLSIFPQPTDLISGQPFMQAVTLGAFDGATVTVERAFMPAWGNVSAGTLVMFSGRMAPVESTRTEAKFKVQSDLELLNIQMPRNIYQPGCMHTLYDTGCSLVKANFAVRGAVTSSSTQSVVNASALTTTSGEFDLGTIEFEAAVVLSGTSGNYVSTPDSMATSVTMDIDIRVKVAIANIAPAAINGIVAKISTAAGNYSYGFVQNASAGISFYMSADGTALVNAASTASLASAGLVNGAITWLRVTRAQASGLVSFYISSDGVLWAQLGTSIVLSAGVSLFDSNSPLLVGTWQAGIFPFTGSIYYTELRNGINGPIVAKFDPTLDTPQGGNILSSTGELWSMNGTAALIGMTNRGVRRTVKSYTPGVFNLITPLPSVPVTGDLFAAYPGCDKQQATCGANVGIVYTVDSTTDIFTATAHGLVNDRAVKLSTTGTFPGAAVALDAVTSYFVINATANTFQLSRTIGGQAIDVTSNGTGTNKVAQVGKFANIINFRGTPFVPVPETMI